MLLASVFVLHNFVKILTINAIELNTSDTILEESEKTVSMKLFILLVTVGVSKVF